MVSRHEDVSCDACNQNNFPLRRFKCLRCFNYDLCGDCYDRQQETHSHLKTHPMQCLLLEADSDIFFKNDSSYAKSPSYTCPLCGLLGLQEAELAAHVFTDHPSGQVSSKIEVNCPICATSQVGNSNTQTQFLSQHLTSKHRLKKSIKSLSNNVNTEHPILAPTHEQLSSVQTKREPPNHHYLNAMSSLSLNNSRKKSVRISNAEKEVASLFAPSSPRKCPLDYKSKPTQQLLAKDTENSCKPELPILASVKSGTIKISPRSSKSHEQSPTRPSELIVSSSNIKSETPFPVDEQINDDNHISEGQIENKTEMCVFDQQSVPDTIKKLNYDDQSSANLVSMLLNTNSLTETTTTQCPTSVSKFNAQNNFKSCESNALNTEENPLFQEDAFDSDWSFFLQELIWKSLHIKEIAK